MDKSRIIHGFKNYRISESSYEDSDESEEDRKEVENVMKLVREPVKKRENIFGGPVDLPKLRKSLAERAARDIVNSTPYEQVPQDIVTSTPFVKAQNCFIDECSLNISPIKPDHEDGKKPENRNTGIIVISSEGESLENKIETHFIPISKLKNNQDSGKLQSEDPALLQSTNKSACVEKNQSLNNSKRRQGQRQERSQEVNERTSTNGTVPGETSKKATRKKKGKAATAIKHTDKNVTKDDKKNSRVSHSEAHLLNPTVPSQSPMRTRSGTRVCKIVEDSQVSSRDKSVENRSRLDKVEDEFKGTIQNVSSMQSERRSIIDKSKHQDGVITSQAKIRDVTNHLPRTNESIQKTVRKTFSANNTYQTSHIDEQVESGTVNKNINVISNVIYKSISMQTSPQLTADHDADSERNFQNITHSKHELSDKKTKRNASNSMITEDEDKIRRSYRLDEIVQSLTRKPSERSVEEAFKEPPSSRELKSAMKSRNKKSVISRSIRFSQPCYEDFNSYEEDFQNGDQNPSSTTKISTKEPLTLGKNMTSKEIQTTPVINKSAKSAYAEDSILLGETDFELFESLSNNEMYLSSFSTRNDTHNNILATSQSRLPFRMNVDRVFPNSRNLDSDFSKLVRLVMHDKCVDEISAASAIGDYSDEGENSLFIHPKEIRESNNNVKKSKASVSNNDVNDVERSDSEEEKNSSAFVRYSRSSLEHQSNEDVFVDNDRVDVQKLKKPDRYETVDGANTPLKFADLEKERCIERFSKNDVRNFQVVRSHGPTNKECLRVNEPNTGKAEVNKKPIEQIKQDIKDCHKSRKSRRGVNRQPSEGLTENFDAILSPRQIRATVDVIEPIQNSPLKEARREKSTYTHRNLQSAQNPNLPGPAIQIEHAVYDEVDEALNSKGNPQQTLQSRRMGFGLERLDETPESVPDSSNTSKRNYSNKSSLNILDTHKMHVISKHQESTNVNPSKVLTPHKRRCSSTREIEDLCPLKKRKSRTPVPRKEEHVGFVMRKSKSFTPQVQTADTNTVSSPLNRHHLSEDDIIPSTQQTPLNTLGLDRLNHLVRSDQRIRQREPVQNLSHGEIDETDLQHNDDTCEHNNEDDLNIQSNQGKMSLSSSNKQTKKSSQTPERSRHSKTLVRSSDRISKSKLVSPNSVQTNKENHLVKENNETERSLRKKSTRSSVTESMARCSLTRRYDEQISPQRTAKLSLSRHGAGDSPGQLHKRVSEEFVIHKSNKSLISQQHNQDVDVVLSPTKRHIPGQSEVISTPKRNTTFSEKVCQNVTSNDQSPADSGVHTEIEENVIQISNSLPENHVRENQRLSEQREERTSSHDIGHDSDIQLPVKQRKLSTSAGQTSKNKKTKTKEQDTDTGQGISGTINDSENAFKKPIGRPKKSRSSKLSTPAEQKDFTSTINESGCRRSGRERRPAPRHCTGIVLLTSERAYKKYVGEKPNPEAIADSSIVSWASSFTNTSSASINRSNQRRKTMKRPPKNTLTPLKESPERENVVHNRNRIEDSRNEPKQLKVLISTTSCIKQSNVDRSTTNHKILVRRNLRSELNTPSTSQESSFSSRNMDCVNFEESLSTEDTPLNRLTLTGKTQEGKNTKSVQRSKRTKRSSKKISKLSSTDEEEPKIERPRRHLSLEDTPQETDSISLPFNEVPVKYIEHNSQFHAVDNVLMTEFMPHVNGGEMGLVKIPPGGRKPFRRSQRALFYCVIAGRGRLQLRTSIQNIANKSRFFIPLGTEYSIVNFSECEDLELFCVSSSAVNN